MKKPRGVGDYEEIIKPKSWRTHYQWIGDTRYIIRIHRHKGWEEFRYGIFKEVVVRELDQSHFEWELQDLAMFVWSARFHLWKLRRFGKGKK
jgi:hypothetical protein